MFFLFGGGRGRQFLLIRLVMFAVLIALVVGFHARGTTVLAIRVVFLLAILAIGGSAGFRRRRQMNRNPNTPAPGLPPYPPPGSGYGAPPPGSYVPPPPPAPRADQGGAWSEPSPTGWAASGSPPPPPVVPPPPESAPHA